MQNISAKADLPPQMFEAKAQAGTDPSLLGQLEMVGGALKMNDLKFFRNHPDFMGINVTPDWRNYVTEAVPGAISQIPVEIKFTTGKARLTVEFEFFQGKDLASANITVNGLLPDSRQAVQKQDLNDGMVELKPSLGSLNISSMKRFDLAT